jgi:phosphatidylglycerol:prolipoprotein diacylglycerol transferase
MPGAVLLFMADRHKINGPGKLFGIYLILNGIERFLIELIRVNTKYHVAGISFTQAEMISLILVLGGIGLIVNASRTRHHKTAKPNARIVN